MMEVWKMKELYNENVINAKGADTIGANEIPKARRFMMFNLSVFDCLGENERKLYNQYIECSKAEDKRSNKEKLLKAVKDFQGMRMIQHSTMYNKSGEIKVDKLIAGFENECVRLSKSFVYNEDDPKDIPLIQEIIILDCPGTDDRSSYSWHEIILKQIIERGLRVDKEEYVVYSASTNQQKKRQVSLLQKKFLIKNQERIMCGLTLDVINDSKMKGCNTGKYLAYTSLIFSKSVEPVIPIQIDEVIVLPEFETKVCDKVNFLDMDTLTIEEKEMDVPVNHMDGAGMFLPGLFPQSCQIRGGWIKGAVFPFDFRQFIIEMQQQGKIEPNAMIKDAWGNTYSIDFIRDNIKILLNASQLKMWEYYKSWDEYKKKFKASNLKICVNNTMHYPDSTDPIVLSAYQFYQTIPRENITDEKIQKLAGLTIHKINDAKVNEDTALEIMGIDIADTSVLQPLYACIKAYPLMLQDSYVRKRIYKKIQSERKAAMSGRPYIRGYYNYICPDLYAACQYWFCKEENPEGLIRRNHVYNALYDNKEDVTEVCCLRSPHLSDCEHGIRTLEKSEECKRWFYGLDTVISTHDLLTKTLQCDVDGDEMLLTSDRAFIDLLDRDKLPLYYEMKKAEPVEVNSDNIFQCLMRSFKNENIGYISNALTKHLNLAAEVDNDFVRVMTAYNNFCIDYPKSQYMPSLGKYSDVYQEWKDREYPYFFKYAKGKMTDQCCDDMKINQLSNVNRISKYIEVQTRNNKNNIWKDSIEGKDYKPQYFGDTRIKTDRRTVTYKALQDLLIELKKYDTDKFREKLLEKFNADKKDKRLAYDIFYFHCNYRILQVVKKYYNVIDRIGYRKKAAAYLLDIEYFQEENKNTNKDILWNCYGDILYENLLYNLTHKPEKLPQIRRIAYRKLEQREEEIQEIVEAVEQEVSDKMTVGIMDYEYDWINGISCRKGCERDRYLLYLLLVLYKRKLKYLDTLENQTFISEDSRNYFKIYTNSRGKKLTRATLDKWLGCDIAKKGLKRFEKKDLIKIQTSKKRGNSYDKIYLQLPESTPDAKVLFRVGGGNPMVDYYRYSGEEKIKECAICHRPFIVTKNSRTCSPGCSRKLELRNKNR